MRKWIFAFVLVLLAAIPSGIAAQNDPIPRACPPFCAAP